MRSNAGVIKDLSDLNEEIWDSNECAECLRICSDVSELAAVGSSLFCNFACFAAVNNLLPHPFGRWTKKRRQSSTTQITRIVLHRISSPSNHTSSSLHVPISWNSKNATRTRRLAVPHAEPVVGSWSYKLTEKTARKWGEKVKIMSELKIKGLSGEKCIIYCAVTSSTVEKLKIRRRLPFPTATNTFLLIYRR